MSREEEPNQLLTHKQAQRVEDPHLQTLMQAPIAICVLHGPKHIFEFANPLYFQLVGNRDLPGKSIREALPEFEGQGLFEQLDRIFTTGEPFIGTEMRIMIDRYRNGVLEEGFFNVVCQPLYSATGEVEGIQTYSVEVTEQVRTRQRTEELAQQLSNERARLGIAQQVARIGTFEWLIPHNRLLWTPELEALYGFASTNRGESTLEEWLEWLHPDDRARILEEIYALINLSTDFQTEFRIVWPDKSIHHLTARARVLRDKKGQPLRLLGANIDITERKQMETLITGQKRALELLVEDAPLTHILDMLLRTIEELSTTGVLTSILLLDKDGLHLRHAAAPSLPENYTKANRWHHYFPGPCAGSCGTAAYRREAVYVSDIAHDPLWADYKVLALSHGLQACWSTPILSPDGKVLGTFATYYREPRSPGEHDKHLIDLVTHTAAIAIERKQTEEQLKESEERFRSSKQVISCRHFSGESPGPNNVYESSCQEITGLTFEETLGLGWMRNIHPDDIEATVSIWTKALSEGSEGTQERRYVHSDGTIRWVKVRSAPMFSDSGEYLGTAGTVEDITEQKIADQRKDEFISMASHELKTPVTSIKGFTQVLQRRFKQHGDAELLRFLNIMDEQLNKLTELISDLLDLSKMQTGQLTYQEAYFDLDVLIQEVLEQFQATISTHQLLLEGKTYARIFGDRDRLRQVLINLLTNAVKYSPHADKVIIRVSTEQDCARVDVQDFGLGISEAHHEKIFDQFYQVADPEAKTFPGLGIGLYISREIIKRYHGQLWVQSTKGNGSTFSIRLPLAESKEIHPD